MALSGFTACSVSVISVSRSATVSAICRVFWCWVLPSVPEPRRKYLEAAVRAAWESAEFQEFNRQRSMTMIPSYLDHEGAKALIAKEIDVYREAYRAIGLGQ